MRPSTLAVSLLLHGVAAVTLGCWVVAAGARPPLVVAHCAVEPAQPSVALPPPRAAQVEPLREEVEALVALQPFPELLEEAWRPDAPAPRAPAEPQLRAQPADEAWTAAVVPAAEADPNESDSIAESAPAPALPFVPAAALDDRNQPPEYPARAIRLRMEGTVLLDVSVGTDGRVAAIAVASSSGHDLLDRAALRAVRAWQFRPAHQGADLRADRLQIPVEFHLKP